MTAQGPDDPQLAAQAGLPATPGTSRRLQCVDALRAVAAFWVVLSHSALGTGHPSALVRWLVPVGQLGYAGVGLFLVLSGFSIHLRWAQGRAGDFSALTFWKRRFVRLYPTYLIALATVFLVLVAFFGVDAISAEANAFERIPIWHAAPWLAVINSALVVGANFWIVALLPQAWSLALEEQIYLLYSLKGRVWSARPFRLLVIAGVVSIAFRVTTSVLASPDTARYVMYFHLPSRAFEWVLGLVIAEAYAGRVRLPRFCSSLPLALTVIALTGYFSLHPAGWIDWNHRFAVSIILAEPMFGVGFAMLLGWFLHNEERLLDSWMATGLRSLAKVGLFSYSMYLLHPAILRVMAYLLPGTGPLRRLVFWSAVVVLSWIFYLLVERHFIARASGRRRVEQ